jgi:hypothetical protein
MSAADDVIKLTIFNSALRQAQSPRIQKITETSASAMACDDMYGPIYDEALMAFEWPWARKRLAVVANVTDPIGDEWEAQYALPADFTRIHKIDTDGINEYEIEGTNLFCNNDAGITLVYFYTPVAETLTSFIFRRLVEKRLATQLALDLSKNRILSMQLDRGAGLLMLEAYRECTEWSREDEPLTLRSPGYSARVPTYGNV